MSPGSLASLGARSPRTVGHGRQPASRLLRSASALRVTAAADRAGSPCGPAGRLALDSLPASATPASCSVVAEHHRLLPDGPRTSSRPRAVAEELRARDPGSGSRSRGGGYGFGLGCLGTVGVEAGAGAEHRAGDVEQAVGHRAQSARVSVAPGAERPVLVVADGIALGSDAGPVVGGVAQPVVGRLAPGHDHALARTAGDRSHPAQTAKCVVVPPPHGIAALAKQRSEHLGADAGRTLSCARRSAPGRSG